MKIKHWFISIVAFAVLVMFDQWTKWLAVIKLKGNTPVVLLDGVFEFYYFENHGAAFGVLQNKRILLIIVTSIILIGILWMFAKIPNTKKYLPMKIVAVVVAAGAVGNFIDRICNGYVVDFLYFKWINFPIFNVADCYVVVSMVTMILLSFFYYKDEDFEVLKKSHKN
ncbi:MAG: signal peptidase II [Candidatus Fimimorpha sp.]